MAFAVTAFFDSDSETKIRSIWRDMAKGGIATYLHQSGARPHIKLATYEFLNVGESRPRLATIAATTEAMPVNMKYTGVFPTPNPIIFLGAAISQSLVNLQRRIVTELDGITQSLSEHFLPGQWIPHCLLSIDTDREKLGRGLDLALEMNLPDCFLVLEIGVVEFRPIDYLYSFTLQNHS
jgi:hypothetical protein